MIAVLKETATEQQIQNLTSWFESQGLKVNRSQGDFVTILGLIGDTTKIDIDLLRGLDIIDNVMRISEPFKKANRKFHPEDSIVDIGGVKIGGGNFAVMRHQAFDQGKRDHRSSHRIRDHEPRSGACIRGC